MQLSEQEERLLRRAEFRHAGRISRWVPIAGFLVLAILMARLLITNAIFIYHEAELRHISVSDVLALDWLAENAIPRRDAHLLMAVLVVHGTGLVLLISILGILLAVSSAVSGDTAQQSLLIRMAGRLRELNELPPFQFKKSQPR